jgi:hypothetical protein
MSMVSKSNVPHLGADTLPTLSSLAVTAASYTARVEADGGRIVDPSALASAFTFLAAQGMSARNFIHGASFGVRDVNGQIDKIYAFNGNDLVRSDPGNQVREMWTLDESGSFPVFKVEVTAANRFPESMKTQSTHYLMRPGHTGYVAAAAGVNMVASDNQYLIALSAHPPGGLPPHAFSIEGFNTDSALNKYRVIVPNGAYDPANAANFTLRYDAGTPYADYAAIAAYIDTTNRQVTTWNNGVVVANASNLDGLGFAWTAGSFNPAATLMQFTMGSTVDSGATTRYNKQKVAEVWHVSGGTSAFGLALSQRLDTLYS